MAGRRSAPAALSACLPALTALPPPAAPPAPLHPCCPPALQIGAWCSAGLLAAPPGASSTTASQGRRGLLGCTWKGGLSRRPVAGRKVTCPDTRHCCAAVGSPLVPPSRRESSLSPTGHVHGSHHVVDGGQQTDTSASMGMNGRHGINLHVPACKALPSWVVRGL